MHKMFEKQLSIMEPAPAHPKVQEYEAMSHILDRNRTIYELALQDLTKNVKTFETGANGMTAEQVVRASCYQTI